MPQFSTAMSQACAGLRLTPRALPHSLMWDAPGVAVFQKIKKLEGYYQARVEAGILENLSATIADNFSGKITLVDYGASSVDKALPLLVAIKPENYVAVDLAIDALASIEESLDREIPAHKFHIFEIAHDFRLPLTLPAETCGQIRVGLCAGQTLGNFEPYEFRQCLAEMRRTLGENAFLLIGMDIATDEEKLLNAYSDPHGITEGFVLNVLTRLNREGDGNFDISKFTYLPVWEKRESRIALYIVSKIKQKVRFCGEDFHFDAGEKIHVVSSYKYSIDEFKKRIAKTGWEYVMSLPDDQNQCAIHLLRAELGGSS
jgi:dimethylhistidine N-methyltransferase